MLPGSPHSHASLKTKPLKLDVAMSHSNNPRWRPFFLVSCDTDLHVIRGDSIFSKKGCQVPALIHTHG